VPPKSPDSDFAITDQQATGRRFADIGALDLELGGSLPSVRLAYESWGRPRRNAAGEVINAVLILHALTGDSHVTGTTGPGQPSPGWWDGLIGRDCALDPGEWWIVAANVLGRCQGSTGPSTNAPDRRAWGVVDSHASQSAIRSPLKCGWPTRSGSVISRL
jgi:homoserine O-acetyltransferase